MVRPVILRSNIAEHATKDLSVGLTERFFGSRPIRDPQNDWPWEHWP